ncbi:recombinase family protein [Bradyrhizobium japonicum]|uniref:recombinase family protein n=1 Tax=Bradyrhizobium japonicum TaxID=375 RepID=UPI0004B29473|nr:recombinase family protein [Bradyrhizobium japonicum]
MRYFIYCRKSSEAEDRQVASIESQLTTLKRAFVDRSDIEIAGIYEESFSAKAPGRPQFGEMLAQIEKGAAHGIIAWATDRLARNSIDSGRIIYMLDCGVIRDLKFPTHTFENNSQGKFISSETLMSSAAIGAHLLGSLGGCLSENDINVLSNPLMRSFVAAKP